LNAGLDCVRQNLLLLRMPPKTGFSSLTDFY
jgi:hypothetical protein